MKDALTNRRTFSILLFFIMVLSVSIYYFQNYNKISRKNGIKFVKVGKKSNVELVNLDKQDKDVILKFKNENDKCILNSEDRASFAKIKENLQYMAGKIDPNAKKRQVNIKFSEAKKITGRNDIKSIVYAFRKCRSENLKKYTPDKKKDLKKIISKLSLNEIIEIYEGIN